MKRTASTRKARRSPEGDRRAEGFRVGSIDQPKIFLNELETLLKKPFDFVLATTFFAVEEVELFEAVAVDEFEVELVAVVEAVVVTAGLGCVVVVGKARVAAGITTVGLEAELAWPVTAVTGVAAALVPAVGFTAEAFGIGIPAA